MNKLKIWPAYQSLNSRKSTLKSSAFRYILPKGKYKQEQLNEIKSILGVQGNRFNCLYCGAKSTQIDHINPIIDRSGNFTGYIHEPGNLAPVCSSCNNKKGSKSFEDFLKNCEDEERKEIIERYIETVRSEELINIRDSEVFLSKKFQDYMQGINDIYDLITRTQRIAQELKKELKSEYDKKVKNRD